MKRAGEMRPGSSSGRKMSVSTKATYISAAATTISTRYLSAAAIARVPTNALVPTGKSTIANTAVRPVKASSSVVMNGSWSSSTVPTWAKISKVVGTKFSPWGKCHAATKAKPPSVRKTSKNVRLRALRISVTPSKRVGSSTGIWVAINNWVSTVPRAIKITNPVRRRSTKVLSAIVIGKKIRSR